MTPSFGCQYVHSAVQLTVEPDQTISYIDLHWPWQVFEDVAVTAHRMKSNFQAVRWLAAIHPAPQLLRRIEVWRLAVREVLVVHLNLPDPCLGLGAYNHRAFNQYVSTVPVGDQDDNLPVFFEVQNSVYARQLVAHYEVRLPSLMCELLLKDEDRQPGCNYGYPATESRKPFPQIGAAASKSDLQQKSHQDSASKNCSQSDGGSLVLHDIKSIAVGGPS